MLYYKYTEERNLTSPQKQMTNTITINNKEYVVIKEEKFTHKGSKRTQWQVRKPQGKRVYFVIEYANGLFSSFA